MGKIVGLEFKVPKGPTKAEIIAELESKGYVYDKNATKDGLLQALEAAVPAGKEDEKEIHPPGGDPGTGNDNGSGGATE